MNELIDFTDDKIALDKSSSVEQLRDYFRSLLVLYKSGEEHPVDIDEVWMLVYARRDIAVRELRKVFIEGEDYVSFHQKVERKHGGSVKVRYKLSVSCFEYFIARKERSVFDVYREVFKKVATGEVAVVAPKTSAEMFLMQAQAMVEAEKRLANLEGKQAIVEEKVSEIAARTKTDAQYSTIVGFANRYGIKVPLEKASVLGRVAMNLCRQFLLETGKTPDPRFGTVRTYPDSVLYETFEKYYPNVRFR